MKSLYACKRVARGDGIDEYEAFSVPDPLVSQRGILFLSRRVQNLQHAGLLVDYYLFAVGVFDCGVVGLHEMVQTELFTGSVRRPLTADEQQLAHVPG